jgi:hypothetical protein
VASVVEIVRPVRHVSERERSSANLPILLRIPSYLPNIPASVIPGNDGWDAPRTKIPPAKVLGRKRRRWPRVLGAIALIGISLVPTAIINQRTLRPYVREAVCWITAVRASFTSNATPAETKVKKVRARRTVKPAEPLPAPVVRLDAYIVPIDSGAVR